MPLEFKSVTSQNKAHTIEKLDETPGGHEEESVDGILEYDLAHLEHFLRTRLIDTKR